LSDDDDLKGDELLRYVQGGLSGEDQHKVERQIADSEFVSDAMDGLQQVRDKKSIDQYVEELNRQLHKQVAAKKKRKQKRKLKEYPWITIAVLVVLGICLLTYVVMRYYQKHQDADPKPSTAIEVFSSMLSWR
jgi:hypothetical protein